MNNKEQTILIWILAAASLVLLLLYSPWGSPDIYTKRVYFAENQGVDFSKINIGRSSFEVSCLKSGLGSVRAGVSSLSAIRNATKSIQNYSNDNYEIRVEDNYTKRKEENKPTVSQYNNSAAKKNRIIAYNKISNSQGNAHKYSSRGESISSYSNGSSASGGDAGSNGGFSMNSGGISSMNSNSGQIDRGISSLNVNLTMYNDSTIMMGMDSPQKAISDPGDGPINGEPVPVGEGWIFLLILGAIYAVIKKRVFSSLLSN